MPAVAATMQNIYGASVSSLPIFNTGLFWEALLLAFAGLSLALVLPLLRATAMSPDESSARDETLVLRRDAALAVVGLVLRLLAYVCYPNASSVVQGFALLSVVLFAGVALLPISVLSVSALSRAVIRQH